MRRVALTILCSAIALSFAACGDDGAVGDEPPASGIAGIVTAGPRCPVVVEGSPCPDAPWRGTVRVTTLEGTLVGEVDTDDEGRFRLPLAPGDYEVAVAAEASRPPTASSEAVTVVDGRWINVELTVDTGIR